MMKKQIIAWLLALIVLAFCGCGADAPATTTANPATPNQTVPPTTNAQTVPPTTNAQTVPPTTAPGPNITLGANVEPLSHNDKSWYGVTAKGMAYRDSLTGLYGILSADGRHDTGPVYYNLSIKGDFFQVTLKQPTSPDKIDEVNGTGIVDETGAFLVPAEYAVIELCENRRFFRVTKATEVTESKDEALLYMHTGWFSIAPSEGDTLYKGVWYFYDSEAGKVIDGIALTNKNTGNVSGDLVTFYDDEGNYVKANTRGDRLPEDVAIMENGSYHEYNGSTVYNVFGEKVFDFDPEAINYINWEAGFYWAQIKEHGHCYVVLDDSGDEISARFPSNGRLCIYGENLVSLGSVLYDFAGNQLFEGKFNSVLKHGDVWEITNYDTKQFHLLDKNLTVFFTGGEQDDYQAYNGCVTRQEGSKTLIYSFKQEAFVYEGDPVDHGFIRVKRGEDSCDLINTYTDEIVISGPYGSFAVTKDSDSGYYLYANYPWDGIYIYTCK